jgi:hypothetical protein
LEEQLDYIEQGMDHKVFLQETLHKIDGLLPITFEPKVYPSLHAGTYRSYPVVLKEGRYGYYMDYKQQSISLKDFPRYESIQGWIKNQSMPPESLKELMDYRDKNSNILVHLNSEWSLRKGPRGPYLFHKTVKMKRPKFYNYPIGLGQTPEEIEEYIQKNIKL